MGQSGGVTEPATEYNEALRASLLIRETLAAGQPPAGWPAGGCEQRIDRQSVKAKPWRALAALAALTGSPALPPTARRIERQSGKTRRKR